MAQDDDGVEVCAVCREGLQPDGAPPAPAVTTRACGHAFHAACWRTYAAYAVNDGRAVRCMLCNADDAAGTAEARALEPALARWRRTLHVWFKRLHRALITLWLLYHMYATCSRVMERRRAAATAADAGAGAALGATAEACHFASYGGGLCRLNATHARAVFAYDAEGACAFALTPGSMHNYAAPAHGTAATLPAVFGAGVERLGAQIDADMRVVRHVCWVVQTADDMLIAASIDTHDAAPPCGGVCTAADLLGGGDAVDYGDPTTVAYTRTQTAAARTSIVCNPFDVMCLFNFGRQ